MKNMYKEKRNIDPILKKGMDITISILKQEYPFIIDWDYNEDTDIYHTALYIDLICDLKKVSEFYDSEVHFHYKDDPISKHVYPLGPLNKNREIGSDEKYEFYKEILNELNEIYGNLPEDYTEKTEWDETKPIKVDHFIFFNKQDTINESKQNSKKDLINKVLNDLVLPQYEHIICGFELKNVDDESLNSVINYPGVIVKMIGGKGTRMWPQTSGIQKMYDDVLDDIWDTVWNYTGIALELYSKYVKDCGSENINESEEETTNYIPIIEEIIEPFRNEDGVCDINVYYGDEDHMYYVYLVFGTEELNDKFFYVDEIRRYRNKLTTKTKTEIESYLPIKNIIVGSYGKPNCGWSPLNESVMGPEFLDLIKTIVDIYKDDNTICDIEVSYDDEDGMYGIYIIFDSEELLKIRDGGGYARQIRNKIGEDIVKYIPDFLNFYVGSYVRHCKESINENWYKIPSSEFGSLEKIINLEMKEKYSWWKDIKINTLNYIELYGDAQIEAELTVDEEWGANQWGEFYYNTKFPGNKGWEDNDDHIRVSLGDIIDSTYAQEIRDDLREIFKYTLNIDVYNMSFINVYLIFE